MPAKDKDKPEDQPVEPMNPAMAAHHANQPDEPAKAEAKPEPGHFNDLTDGGRSAHTDEPPKKPVSSKAKPTADDADPSDDDAASPKAKADEPPAPPAQCQRTIEDLLADPTFDTEGKVRTKLAMISAKQGIGQKAPADLVTADGKPVA